MPDPASWNILNRNLFFVKDAVKRSEAKFSDKLDVHDPKTKELLIEVREPDIGFFVKIGRLFGGKHDRGTPFNFVARIPNGKQILRIKRAGATFTFGGAPMVISNEKDESIGTLNRKRLAMGLQFEYASATGGENFVLEMDTDFFGGNGELSIDGDLKATVSNDGNTDHGGYFREGGFDYAISILPDVPANDIRRQILFAVALAKHRVKI